MSMGPSPPSSGEIIGSGTQLAGQQWPYNIAAQAGSQYNQVGPYGSLNYVQTGTGPGGVPIYTAKTKLSPAQQKLLNQYQQTQLTAASAANPMLAMGHYGSESPSQAIGDMASGLTGQGMQQGLSFLQPFFTTQTTQLDAQLKNQGLMPGQPAYDNAMRQMQTNQGLQVNQMMESLFPTEQQFAMKEYGLPLEMAQQLMQTGAPASPTTGFTSALPGIQAPNVIGAATGMGALDMQSYQAQQAQQNAMLGALMGIPSALAGGWAMRGFPGLPT